MKKLLYTPYSHFLAQHFKSKVQKLPLDVGADCPVRDGKIAVGGCAFCNGRSFVPNLCSSVRSVTEQIEMGKHFFQRKHSAHLSVDYLAYFQAGSNTYASVDNVSPLIEEALAAERVRGVVLATRPDCLSSAWLKYLSALAQRTFVMVELGVESVNDEVLQRVGRGHTVGVSQRAILSLAACGVAVGVHLILGLPGDNRQSMLRQAEWLSALPVDVLKLHQLQILRGARMARMYADNPADFHLFDLDTYVCLVADYLERLHARIAVERFVSQSPGSALIAPRWGLKNDEVTQRITAELQRRGSCQGVYAEL